MMRFKGLNGNICKMMMSHFGTLLVVYSAAIPLYVSPCNIKCTVGNCISYHYQMDQVTFLPPP